MDIDAVKNAIVKNVYHIDAAKKVPLHKHPKHDEVFYCIAGGGFGVLETGETALAAGKAFIVPAGVMHSLRTDGDLFVASFLIPVQTGQ
ncbi:MAG TPA: cupin domain-containing protein [Candidatus Aminicenantes bacterium]|nr:cupin domain-containing protein [Candidatus Aminicenantes bacterium]